MEATPLLISFVVPLRLPKKYVMKILKKQILEAIDDYNRHRSPEATAKLVKQAGSSVFIEFSGAFCKTCGFRDWFDDMAISLQDELEAFVEIKNVAEKGKDRFVVEFLVKQ